MSKILLNASEASDLLGISVSTLYRLTSQGLLNRRRISCNRVGWLHSDLLRFAEALPSA